MQKELCLNHDDEEASQLMSLSRDSGYLYLQLGDYTQPGDEVLSLVDRQWMRINAGGYKLTCWSAKHRRKV